MIRGQTFSILPPPIAQRDADAKDVLYPFNIELRNGYRSGAGTWQKRPGYQEKWSLGRNDPVEALIPLDDGYAITEDGQIYVLNGTPTAIAGVTMQGTARPQYAFFHRDTWDTSVAFVVDGGNPVRIAGGLASFVAGDPPLAKYVATLDHRVILAGHDAREFRWSDLENDESWPVANVNSVFGGNEVIKNLRTFNRLLFFFKSNSVEIWVNVGGATVFGRRNSINRGLKASYSLVEAASGLFWLADDGNFVSYYGNLAVISAPYRTQIDSLTQPENVYGFDFTKEHCIRWFAPEDGKCFVYDYQTQQFSEDSRWEHGSHQLLPVNSYMELGGKQYFGDRNGTGKIHEWSRDFADDNGHPIRMSRKFAVADPSGRELRVNKLSLRLNRGEVTGAKTDLRWRLDQGDVNTETLDLGAVGERYPYIDLFSLGIGREIEIELVESDAGDGYVTAMHLTAEATGR